MTGTHLGAYEIGAPLGKGGMGEVYRATDTRLNREVAIKVLPAEVAGDPERLARFRREAQLLAALNHPHVAAIHGLEEADGKPFLVLELVEGEDLAERLGRGPIPVDEATSIAKQIAEALEEAHAKGIVHRDLKPANIKVTPDGKVKVLDFGLAKAWSSDGDGAMGSADGSLSPTLARTGTAAGLILGTAAYMSPEQARGKPVDKRADIWAFGVVLFEMLTGRRLFDGETVSDVLAAVLTREPQWNELPAATPPSVRRLLRRCLERNPKNRQHDIADVRVALDQALSGAPEDWAAASPARPQPLWRRPAPWAALAGVLALAFALALWAPWRKALAPPQPLRLSIELGADASLIIGLSAAILSPDGSVLAFVARRATGGERPLLYVRRLDQLQAAPLSGTDGAYSPFFSPDGRWIGFIADGKLKKIAVTGGAAVALCDAPSSFGGSWAEDGSIVLGARRGGLSRVPSAGGSPEPLTSLDSAAGETSHSWPQALAGGKAVLFTANGTASYFDDANVVVQKLPHGPRKVVVRGGFHARYLESGHVVYVHEGTLFALPFDLDRLEATGEPAPVLEGVRSDPGRGNAQFAFSAGGALVYLPGETWSNVPIRWMDRNGKTEPLRALPASYFNLRFSPDGRQLAMEIRDRKSDVWVYEWSRDTLSRLTFDPGDDAWPQWTPDGRRIAFSSVRGDNATPNLYWQRADGTGEVERLTESPNSQRPASWHPTGRFLAFQEVNPQTGGDIMILPLLGDEAAGWKPGKPTIFLASPVSEWTPAFSPDGRWLAYEAVDTGMGEVYVRPFPGPGGKWQISTGGGRSPTWSRNGKELFYWAADETLMVASYTAVGDSFRAEKPRQWSPARIPLRPLGSRPFDLHPDGQRVAVLMAAEDQAELKRDKVVFIPSFFDELRRLAPPKR